MNELLINQLNSQHEFSDHQFNMSPMNRTVRGRDKEKQRNRSIPLFIKSLSSACVLSTILDAGEFEMSGTAFCPGEAQSHTKDTG